MTGFFAPLGVGDPQCPHCGHRFEKMPQRKRKCPSCKQEFFSRKRTLDGLKVLLTPADAEIVELEQLLASTVQECSVSASALREAVAAVSTTGGQPPTTGTVLWCLLERESERNVSRLDWGLFRNNRFRMGKLRDHEGHKEEALDLYLEVCCVDANGPNNMGGATDPTLLARFPPFRPSRPGLAPGVVGEVARLGESLGLSEEHMQQRFLRIAERDATRYALLLPATDAWNRLRAELYPQ